MHHLSPDLFLTDNERVHPSVLAYIGPNAHVGTSAHALSPSRVFWGILGIWVGEWCVAFTWLYPFRERGHQGEELPWTDREPHQKPRSSTSNHIVGSRMEMRLASGISCRAALCYFRQAPQCLVGPTSTVTPMSLLISRGL